MMAAAEDNNERMMGILRRHSSINHSSTSLMSQEAPPPERPSVTFVDIQPRKTTKKKKKKKTKIREDSIDIETMPLSPTIIRSLSRSEDADDDQDDDYSASVSAMLQRKSSHKSIKRRKHQVSSPFFVEDNTDVPGNSRRRSSAFTTSSGETAISIDVSADEDLEGDATQEQILEKLKLHKEVLSAVKHQPWPLQKKIKLVRQAKSYIRRHEGALQVRLAQSRSTRDALTQASIFLNKKWQYFKRELINLQTWMVPWERRIKEIESHFGSAVASYFTFLRWLFWINFVISLTLTAFVAIPEVLTADKKLAGDRKSILPEEIIKSRHFLTLWEFEGVLKHSPFFYGWYTNRDPPNGGYKLPLAYFVANLTVYTYSFVVILRKMAKNSRMSKLSEKEDECAFSWKLFTGWDFMIGNSETAHNRVASIVLGFKEALLEEAEKEKKLGRWKIITVRIFVNLAVLFLLALSAYAVVEVVARSMQPDADIGWWRQNEITVVLSLISYIFPIFFEILGLLENYHPRRQLRLQLARIMVLNLLNLYSLIIALFDKISHMEEELKSLKPRDTKMQFSMNFNESNCKYIAVPCNEMSSLDSNFLSSTAIPRKLPSNKTSKLTATLTAMSLILLNTTSNYSTNYTDSVEPRINDASDELYMGMDGIALDYLSTASGNFTNISTSPDENTSFLEDGVRWIGYSEKDDLAQNNYEYYDDHDLVYDDKTTWTQDISSSSLSTEPMTMSTDTSVSDNIEQEYTTKEMTAASQKDVEIIKCYARICDEKQDEENKNTGVSIAAISSLNITTKRKLGRLCWETMFGQELAKLTVMDLVLTIIATLAVDFFRALFVRYMNSWWCWDLEKGFPQYGDFKIAENILHLVNNQGMVWMGMFFSPGLAVLNLLKLGILMYLRSWAVMTCNVPHEVVFRASRSNNFYFSLLLTMIFLCVLPVGYAIVWVEPSWHCGPFSGYQRIYHMATKSLKDALPKKVHKALDYAASPGIIIPLIVLMALIIYYMVSLASSLRESNNDLKIQLRYERTEERRKMFKIAEKRSQGQDPSLTKWKKILHAMPSNKNDTQVSRAVGSILQQKRRHAIDRIRSITSEADQATDVEPYSLPHDSLSQNNDDENVNPVDSSTDVNGIDIKQTKIPMIFIDGMTISTKSQEHRQHDSSDDEKIDENTDQHSHSEKPN